jgi:hypothetical protein
MSSKSIPITIIIVTYNSNKHIFKCLKSISKSSSIPEEIIIIDNDSNTSPLNKIKKLSKKLNIKTIQNKTNIGFAKAVNKASKLSTKKNLLFLNPDFYVNNKALENIWRIMNSKLTPTIVGGKAINPDNNKILKTIANKPNFKTLLIEFTSLKKVFESLNFHNASNFWNFTALKARKPLKVDAISGCFMIIKKNWFKKVGKFDPKFKLYLEDLDLCLKINSVGGKVYYNPLSYGYHIEGGSSLNNPNKINQIYWDKSKRYFTQKYFGIFGILLIFLYSIDDILIKIKKKLLK